MNIIRNDTYLTLNFHTYYFILQKLNIFNFLTDINLLTKL